MGEKVKKDIYEYLDKHDGYEPEILIQKIKSMFDLSLIRAMDIYFCWKKQYLVPIIQVDYSKREGWSNR